MKIIALDYDDTYSADPELFSVFIASAQARGHYVMIVTARNSGEGSADIEAALPSLEIIATNGNKKKQFLIDNGYPDPDIWIDDMPELIV